MGNSPDQAESQDGKWTAGASGGDHQAESPKAETRKVPGHGTISRAAPVAMHNHTPSVGTGGGGSGGGGSGGGGRFRRRDVAAAKTKSAKQEMIAMRQQIDERHKPTRTDAGVAGMTDQGRPMAGLTATPGRFRYQQPRH